LIDLCNKAKPRASSPMLSVLVLANKINQNLDIIFNRFASVKPDYSAYKPFKPSLDLFGASL